MNVKISPLQAAHVGDRWEQAQQTLAAARQGLRRGIQVAMAAYAVAALSVQPLSHLQPWLPAMRLAALTLFFAVSAAWFVRMHVVALETPGVAIRPSRGFMLRTVLPLAALTLLLSAWAALTMPLELRPEPVKELPAVPPALAILIPLVTLALLTFRLRPQAVSARLLGLSDLRSPAAVVIGGAAGACLGLHFWIISSAWIPQQPHPPASFQNLVWLLSFTLGLQALAEETFFRGVLYRLYEEPGGAIGMAFAPILLLNAFVYLLPGLVTVLSDMWPWRLVYGLCFAALATWLRNRQGSLAAPIAANVVFTVLFTLGGAL